MTGLLLLTLRDLWAKKVVLGLFIISTLAWVLLAFALNLDVVDGTLAGMRVFGQETGAAETVRNPETGEVVREALGLERIVVAIESVVAGAAYWLGTLLGLFATAPLLADLLTSGRIEGLLAKPISRVQLFGGHVLGVWLTMLLLALYLLGMVWLVMSLKTGVWNGSFFLAIGVVVGMFAVMYSVVALCVVATGSTALSLVVAYGLVFASLILAAKDELAPQILPPWRGVYLGFYHALPHFAEVTATVAQLSGREPVASWYPFAASLALGGLVYVLALVLFRRRDF